MIGSFIIFDHIFTELGQVSRHMTSLKEEPIGRELRKLTCHVDYNNNCNDIVIDLYLSI